MGSVCFVQLCSLKPEAAKLSLLLLFSCLRAVVCSSLVGPQKAGTEQV